MIAKAFEDFAQSLRILVESTYRLIELIKIDRAEAVGNVENSFTSVLNSFASIYDVVRKDKTKMFDWYATPETCIILLIRNAKHHNLANKIQNIFDYHVMHSNDPTDKTDYLVIDFKATEEGARTLEFLVSWNDIQEVLDLPLKTSRLRAGTKELIYSYLNAEKIVGYCFKKKVPEQNVFINAIPLIINAAKKIIHLIKNDVRQKYSVEGDYFVRHFEEMVEYFDTRKHKVQKIKSFRLPQ